MQQIRLKTRRGGGDGESKQGLNNTQTETGEHTSNTQATHRPKRHLKRHLKVNTQTAKWARPTLRLTSNRSDRRVGLQSPASRRARSGEILPVGNSKTDITSIRSKLLQHSPQIQDLSWRAKWNSKVKEQSEDLSQRFKVKIQVGNAN